MVCQNSELRNTPRGPHKEIATRNATFQNAARKPSFKNAARNATFQNVARKPPFKTAARNAGRECRSRDARAGTRNEMREGARGQEPPPESAAQSVGQNVEGRSGSEHGTGVRRPEHGTGARDRSAPPGTRDRSASRGAWVEVRGRVRGRGAEVGARGPECGLEAQEPSLPEHGAGV